MVFVSYCIPSRVNAKIVLLFDVEFLLFFFFSPPRQKKNPTRGDPSMAAALAALLAAVSCAALAAEAEGAPAEGARALRRRRGRLTERTFEAVVDGETSTLRYELFVPNSCLGAAGGAICKQAPVLVFLHGRGESGAYDVTNAQSLPWLLQSNETFARDFDFITAIPQCPQHCAAINKWDPLVLRSITALIEQFLVGVLGGDRSRVYLSGQSMGGHGAWVPQAFC